MNTRTAWPLTPCARTSCPRHSAPGKGVCEIHEVIGLNKYEVAIREPGQHVVRAYNGGPRASDFDIVEADSGAAALSIAMVRFQERADADAA